MFEFNNYPKDSKCYNGANNLVVDKMKYGTSGVPMKGFVGLKSKRYTFITVHNHHSKKAKGINKRIVDDELNYEDYKNVLLIRSCMTYEMSRIQSKNDNIDLHRINKISLPSHDDKKCILKDGCSKLSHFYTFTH